jgi:hypothetical protein
MTFLNFGVWIASLWMMAAPSMHPFHVSVCDMYYNPNKERLEIIHKIFWDDLEDGLSKMAEQPVDVANPADSANLQSLIAQYLDARFSLELDGKQAKLHYLGAELEEDAFWCYQEVADLKDFQKIRVRNQILMEVFDDQMNLIHVEHRKKILSLRLSRRTFEDELIW